MNSAVAARIEALSDMTVAELRLEYARVFGEESRSRHKDYLRKRIAWRLQANEEGGLSERALRRAAELATDADLRLLEPTARTITQPFRSKHDRRLPVPGSVITREYKGRTIVVTVLPNGFEYAGTVYRSLTAIAKAVTGSHWNGRLFFGRALRTPRVAHMTVSAKHTDSNVNDAETTTKPRGGTDR